MEKQTAKELDIWERNFRKSTLTTHDVAWSHWCWNSFCKDQYVTEQPEEQPTLPVRVHIQ